MGNDGSIYIVGSTYGDLNGQTNSGRNDAFIQKRDSEIENSVSSYGNNIVGYVNGVAYSGDFHVMDNGMKMTEQVMVLEQIK